ncbi:fungal-specific transcription factor domain-containing protein [Mariannaea sp. PMI_226]|nr:fungal-specific transcription factor domain-containing protein [Mariannaea sp. PMI_226]
MMVQSASNGRRRDKPTLSCTICRARKLRCDRQSPCGSCVRRGKSAECMYHYSEQERKDAIDYRPHSRRHQVRQRIIRLENIITEMRDRDVVQSSPESSGNVTSSVDAHNSSVSLILPHSHHDADSTGNLSLTDTHSVYVGSSHWGTILEDIRCLKDELSDVYSEDTSSQSSTPLDGRLKYGSPVSKVSLLNGANYLPKEQILDMMPPRKVVDRHVSQFFNAFDLAPVILHRKKFLSEYANFWMKPSDAPIMWVGLLFSIMSISVLLQQQDVGALGLTTVESQNMLESYRTLAIQCLITGDYLRPSRYTIEALMLHFAVDQNVNIDTYIGNWVLNGVVVRIAMRMGLHRDPSHWPSIRPLQAEMRRRAWIALYQMDFFTSTQVGLPRIIKDSQCDTQLPTNLFDDDISIDDDKFPPGRPLTDYTPLSHIIQRNAIIKIAAEIYDATEATASSQILIETLGAKLQSTIDAIPAYFRYSSLENSIVGNPVIIMQRIFLDILIHKAVYLLHRQSFIKPPVGCESSVSNELCIKAALAILEHQRRVSEETQPGGLLYGIRWKVASSLNHEFLQATVMLCFLLNRDYDRHTTAPVQELHRRAEIVEALVLAKVQWEKISAQSVEAQRAAEAITTVLKHVPGQSDDTSISSESIDPTPEVATQCYSGGFSYQQSVAFGPSFSLMDEELTGFGTILEQFSTENLEDWGAF